MDIPSYGPKTFLGDKRVIFHPSPQRRSVSYFFPLFCERSTDSLMDALITFSTGAKLISLNLQFSVPSLFSPGPKNAGASVVPSFFLYITGSFSL